MAALNFDANSVEPNQPFAVLPAGKYLAELIDSDMRATKDGNGQYLWCEFVVLDGEFAGRRVYDRMNIVNQNAQAVEIAQRQLSALCHATGKLTVSDSTQLHHIPVIITVRVRPERGEFGASNELRGFEPTGGARPAASAVRPTPPRPAPAPATTTAPWKQAKKPAVADTDIPF